MSENLNHNLDELFRKELGDFAPTPNSNLWEKIDEEMELQSFDEIIKQELNTIESLPAPHNWEAIQKKIPLHLNLRNHLSNLSKLAAAVVAFIFISTLFQLQTITDDKIASDGTLDKTNFPPVIAEEEPIDFVFDLKETAVEHKSASEELSDEVAKKVEADEFLNFLLEDTDEFADVIDDQRIEDILQPVQQLPIEDITALLKAKEDKTSKEDIQNDLKIEIPLKVVEDHEIDALLRQYDKDHPK